MLLIAVALGAAEPAAAEPEAPAPSEAPEVPPVPEATQPEVFVIPRYTAPLPSAAHRGDLSSLDTADPEEQDFEPALFDRRALVRGAWFIRPRLAFQQLIRDGEDGSALRLGLSAGRRWWTLEDLPVQVAADVGLRATAPVGQGTGRRVEALARIGPWLGPVRVVVGAVLRWEAERWHGGAVQLADALHLGPDLGLGVDLGPVHAGLGVQPAWQLAGDRARPEAPVLPNLGHETTWSATLGLDLRPVGFTVDSAWRDTAIGGALEVGLSLHIALGSQL